MSRKIAEEKYVTTVKKFGNGAHIKSAKKHIGKKVRIEIVVDEEKRDNSMDDIEHSAGSDGWEKV